MVEKWRISFLECIFSLKAEGQQGILGQESGAREPYGLECAQAGEKIGCRMMEMQPILHVCPCAFRIHRDPSLRSG